MKTHFIIVGAQRSGTTYLYKLLKQHPDICIAEPVKPEPKYFMNKSESDLNLEEYYKNFFGNCCNKQKVYGEKSTSYYQKEESARLISTLLPNVKIIFLLRNPVKRAISNYFFSLNHGLETRSLEEVFLFNKKEPCYDANAISVNPFDYKKRGEYASFIQMYTKYFEMNQIKIIIFEELVNNINKIEDIYTFLNIDISFRAKDTDKIVNSSEKKSIIPLNIVDALGSYYQDSIESLETILGRSIDVWK